MAVDVDTERTVEDTGALHEQHLRARALVPASEDFEGEGEDDDGNAVMEEFIPAPGLEQLAGTLIERENLPAQYFPITILWKRKGGTSKGRPVRGKCTKASGLTRYFAGNSQFVIWVAADHAERDEITNYELEAIVFHELLHIDVSTDDDGNTTPRLKDHDFEGFHRDIEVYGQWDSSKRRLANTFRQAPLIPDDYIS